MQWSESVGKYLGIRDLRKLGLSSSDIAHCVSLTAVTITITMTDSHRYVCREALLHPKHGSKLAAC